MVVANEGAVVRIIYYTMLKDDKICLRELINCQNREYFFYSLKSNYKHAVDSKSTISKRGNFQ